MAEMSPPNASPGIAAWLALTETELRDSAPLEPIRSLRSRRVVEQDHSLALSTISNLLRASFVTPALCARLQSPEEIAKRASMLMPKKQWKVQLGDFGEALALGVLEGLQGLCVPVVKLQGLHTSNETQHGIDQVAFKIDENKVLREIWFVECKAGTTKKSHAGVEACSELSRQREDEEVIWHLLNYYMERLSRNDEDLADQLFQYLKGAGSDSGCSEEHELFFLWESQEWHPSANEYLQRCEACKERTTGGPKCAESRHAVFFFQNDLASLVKYAYQAYGITASPPEHESD